MNLKSKNSIKIISYNLKYNRANSELKSLVENYDADILCLQECHADKLPDEIQHLTLGDATPNSRLNIAIYYRKGRFFTTDSSSHVLKSAVLERIFMPQMERLLVTKIYDRESRKEITVGSFHATSQVATNIIRKHQITTAHQLLMDKSEPGNPTVMVGDYNYLLFKNGLRMCVKKSGYDLALSETPTYYFNRYLGLGSRLDLATSMNAQIERIFSLPKSKLSDHTPILVHVTV